MNDRNPIKGTLTLRVTRPDGTYREHTFENLITEVGDQMYGELGSGAGTPNIPTGLRLGTGVTAAAKSGAGAAIVTYVTGSAQAFDATYPLSALSGGLRRITYRVSYVAGTIIATIQEAAITNENPLTDVAGTAANTIARAIPAAPIAVTAVDTLTATWTHDLGTL